MSAGARLVMVVEDSDEDFDTVRVAFEQAGLSNELRRVTSGGMCLQVLRGTGGEPIRPALVILDLNTPGTNGREVLQIIKTDPGLRDLPVVVLTTSSHASTEHIQVVLAVFGYWLEKVVLPDPEVPAP